MLLSRCSEHVVSSALRPIESPKRVASTGTRDMNLVPSPNWPDSLFPQQYTAPARSRAHAWSQPAAICTTSCNPGTCTGVLDEVTDVAANGNRPPVVQHHAKPIEDHEHAKPHPVATPTIGPRAATSTGTSLPTEANAPNRPQHTTLPPRRTAQAVPLPPESIMTASSRPGIVVTAIVSPGETSLGSQHTTCPVLRSAQLSEIATASVTPTSTNPPRTTVGLGTIVEDATTVVVVEVGVARTDEVLAAIEGTEDGTAGVDVACGVLN